MDTTQPFDEGTHGETADPRLIFLTHDIPPAAKGLAIGVDMHSIRLPADCEVVHRNSDADNDVFDDFRSSPAIRDNSNYYEFVIADKVAHYNPDILRWFRDIYDVLRPGGVLNIALPYHVFDSCIGRGVSTIGEAVEAYHLAFKRPSIRQIFNDRYNDVDDGNNLKLAYSHAMAVSEPSSFHCQCWFFTPLSFVDFITAATRLGIFPFVINQISDVAPTASEFFVSFRRDHEEASLPLRNLQLFGLSYLRDRILDQLR